MIGERLRQDFQQSWRSSTLRPCRNACLSHTLVSGAKYQCRFPISEICFGDETKKRLSADLHVLNDQPTPRRKKPCAQRYWSEITRVDCNDRIHYTGDIKSYSGPPKSVTTDAVQWDNRWTAEILILPDLCTFRSSVSAQAISNAIEFDNIPLGHKCSLTKTQHEVPFLARQWQTCLKEL